ncbi:MAG: hypothetical protein KJ043_11450, partial [Anaerolineae bacterium]|nr:hypothetical protein [Anaerolineae bacterium]
VMMSVFVGIGSIVLGQIVGHDMGVFDANTFGKFVRDMLSQMGLTLVTTFIATGYTALAAMYSKNIIGTIFIGLLITLGEPTVLLLVSLGRSLLSIDLFPLYLLTPSHNMSSIRNAEMGMEPFIPLAPEGFVPFSLTISWLILVGWIVFLIALSIRNFTRQDITS